jgi:predicted AlkP superfamily phosphohydrolase/phosphomutase
MSQTNNTQRLLAIAVDAADPRFVRQLIEQGHMPSLQRLLSEGKYFRVESTAGIGSGSVWPTFITGQDAQVHGAYGEWWWDPQTMKLGRYRPQNVKPFWTELAEQGISVGVLDVPFMPMVGLRAGFEISEWGPHDVVEGKTRVGPDSVAEIVNRNSPHPLQSGIAVSGQDDYQNLEKLGNACLNGIKLRGALTKDLIAATHPKFLLIAFTEIHRSAHYLWHHVETDHPVYRHSGIANLTITRPTMHEIYGELDRQIGELIKTEDEGTSVMVFSLHGMRPTHGAPALLGPWLCELGFSRFGDWGTQSWRNRARGLMARMKKLSPAGLKKLYYKILPATATHRLAMPTMLPLYDWSQTRAFALPTDQHGWIRINLIGRESQGIVPAGQYQDICSDLEERLRDLKSEDGAPLVRDIIRTADHVEDALNQRIPDIVIHWEDKVFESPLRIKESAVDVETVGKKYSGQHSLEGFCILRSEIDLVDAEVLSSKELHQLIRRLLGVSDEGPQVFD